MKHKLSKEDAEFLGHMEPHKLKGPAFISHIILYSVLILLGVALLWAHLAIIDEVIKGEGKVIPSRQIQIVQNLEGGIVEKILVTEGEIVKEGQPLLIIDDTRYLATYNESLVKEQTLEIKYLRLKAEIDQKPFVVPANLAKKIPDAVKYEMDLYKSRQQELNQLKDSYDLAKKELEMTKPLVAKGAASPVEVLRLQRAVSDLYGKVIAFNTEALDELSKVKAELNSTQEANEANIDRIKRSTVRSPVRGVIKQLLVHTVGGVVQPGSDLVEIVPLDDTLLVEAKVDPKDIGFLIPGQSATVTISAFDYAKYGSLDGQVEQISADTITDEKSQKTYYLVKVRTQKNYLGTKQHPLYIIPGMLAHISVKVGERSVLNYIISPLVNSLSHALREK